MWFRWHLGRHTRIETITDLTGTDHVFATERYCNLIFEDILVSY